MSQAYLSHYVHFVFSTKGRMRTIHDKHKEQLWAYLHGIAKNIGCRTLAIRGMEDHVHLLVEVPATLSLAKIVATLKSNSSRWMREKSPAFTWQRGYGAFSVSASNLPAVKEYIHGQEAHHKKRDYKAEFIALLKKHDVEYDPRYVFD